MTASARQMDRSNAQKAGTDNVCPLELLWTVGKPKRMGPCECKQKARMGMNPGECPADMLGLLSTGPEGVAFL